jgi:hypothetical protein
VAVTSVVEKRIAVECQDTSDGSIAGSQLLLRDPIVNPLYSLDFKTIVLLRSEDCRENECTLLHT